jgi:hypothetical protein
MQDMRKLARFLALSASSATVGFVWGEIEERYGRNMADYLKKNCSIFPLR